jgi:deuterolysin
LIFIILAAVASLYDFASAGAGTFTFEPVSTFQVIDDTDRSALQVPSKKIDVSVEKDVAKREIKQNAKRATVSCSNSSQNSFISSRSVLF